MDPDRYQQAWQAHSSQARFAIDADLLLKEVQRNRRDFRETIFWRDFREVGVATLLIPVWFYLGARNSSPGTWYLTVPVLIWIAGFMLVYRLRHPQKPSVPDEPLLECVTNSLTQVEDQIWLLRNIFWWYLLPPGVSIMAFFAHVCWLTAIETSDWLLAFGVATFLFLFLLGLYSFIYYLNQRAVNSQLEPRRQELLTLLGNLKDETSSEDDPDRQLHDESGSSAAMTSAASVKTSATLGRTLTFMCLMAALTALASVAAFFAGRAAAGSPTLSPFAAVRWQDSQPEVKVGDEWFKLVSLNDLPTSKIVAFSQRTYGNLWQKRFEEDLVELLTRMGHPPQDTVTLVVQSLKSSETRTLEDVPMTRANRRAIRDAAQAREPSEQPQGDAPRRSH